MLIKISAILKELLAPFGETLETILGLLCVGIHLVLEPFDKQFLVLLQHQVLAEHDKCLQEANFDLATNVDIDQRQ